jgi:SSS family solute:Na+ symporter
MTPLLIICCYLALLIGLGVVSSRLSRGTSEDYMLASHSIGPVLLLMSLFGTAMTAFALVGSTGESYQVGIGVYGMLASSSGIVHSLCFFVIGVKMWQIGRRHRYRTQIQFYRDRLESIGILGGGKTIEVITHGSFPDLFPATKGGVPAWLGELAICGVVLVYVFLGGMRGTAWANTFQTAVFMVLGVVTFFVIADGIGGEDSLLANMEAATAQVAELNPKKLTREEVSPLVFFSYMLIPLSAGTFPHLFQHWLTAKSANSFKLTVTAYPIFIMIVWLPCVLIGTWATSAMLDGKPIIPPNFNPNAVLGKLVDTLSGDLLGGLLTAGILAAVMSSLDSQFLCLGTIFTEDIVVHYGGKDRFSDRQTVLLARGFIVGIVVVCYLLALVAPRSVFDLGIWCFSGFASLVPLTVAAIYWKRLTKAGAYASILVTGLLWAYFFWDSDFAANDKYTVFGMLPVGAMFVASAVTLVAVSLVSKPPSNATLRRFFEAPR